MGSTVSAAPAATRTLCICVDDFGLNEGVNAAVSDLAQRRHISAAGFMVKRKGVLDGAVRLVDISAEILSVGLHLDMGPLLDADGGDGSLGRLIAASYLGALDPAAVRAEIVEQLDRFEHLTGRPPAFVDGYQHVHQLPVVREALVEEIVRRYAAHRPWLRITAPMRETWLPRDRQGLVFSLGGRGLRLLAAQHGIATNRRLLGFYGYEGTREDYRLRLLGWLRDCESGDVLMCHPSAEAHGDCRHSGARRDEFAVLQALDLGTGGVSLSAQFGN